MPEALALHDSVLNAAVAANGGRRFKHTGDGMAVVFGNADSAVQTSVDAQRALVHADWPETGQLHVRMGVHTGSAVDREGDFFGTAVNKAARLMGVGHGGQVLVSDATAALLGESDGWHLIDLGPHRLRDLAGSVEIMQAVGSGLVTDFAPLRTLDAYASNLPANLPSYVGRDDLVIELENELFTSPLVTLVGIGGIGKTRLAQQVGAHVLPHYADGTWFVDLAAVRDTEDLCPTVARALGVKEQSTESLEVTLQASLRTKKLLLILDNCEQATEFVAEMVETIMRAAPDVRFLATSRERLGIRGERVRRLAGLDDESALALFIQRAADAGTAVDVVTERDVIVELCRHIDGLPLAIELAAARTTTMSPAQILEKVGSRFRLLRAKDRRTDRHQTLQNMIDWSYEMLTDEQKAVLQRLSVFDGFFDMSSVEQVIADDDLDEFTVVDTVDELVSKSLVTAEQVGDIVTLRLMETVREYAMALLIETGGRDEVLARHTSYFSKRARSLGGRLAGSELESASLTIGFEIANIDAVMDRLRDGGEFDELAQLVSALSSYWPIAAPASGRARYAELVAVADRMDPDVGLGTLIAAGAFFAEQGYVADGRAALEHARQLAADENLDVPAFLYYAAAGIAEIDGQPTEVLSLAATGLAIAEDDPFTRVALRLRMLTSVLKDDGASAVSHAQQTVDEAEELGLDMFVAAGHFLIGTAEVLVGDNVRGIAALDHSIKLAGAAVPQVTIGALVLKAIAARDDDAEECVRLAQQAIRLEAEHSVMPAFRVIAGDLIAEIAATQGDRERAARILGAGAGLRERLGFSGLWWASELHSEACELARDGYPSFDDTYEAGKHLAAAEVRLLLLATEDGSTP